MKKWYIKERHNPQLGVYYVPEGQMSKASAKELEVSAYGENYMLPFDTQEAYEDKLKELRDSGQKVA